MIGARSIAGAVAAIAIALPAVALAHGGGLDAMGCHHNRKAGGYHCHRGPLAGQSFTSKEDATRALQRVSQAQQPARPSPPQAAPPAPAMLSGVASVIDGDTLEIHGQRIRLHGVDAPEAAQLCRDMRGKDYRCGQQAALALADRIGRQTIECEKRDVDRYKRIVAVCRLGAEDLSAWLVSEGWAMAYRRYSTDYVRQEESARSAGLRIWQGEFTTPSEWRAKKAGGK